MPNAGVLGKVFGFAVGGRRMCSPPDEIRGLFDTHSMPTGSDPVGAANRMRDRVILGHGPPAPDPVVIQQRRATVLGHCRGTCRSGPLNPTEWQKDRCPL